MAAPNAPVVQLLGQSSVRFRTSVGSILVDPYLTDSVAEAYGEELRRLSPPPMSFSDLADTRVILITHAHLDHCDPASVLGLLEHAPDARIIAPHSARATLRDAGIDDARLEAAAESWIPLFGPVRVHAVPAAHPAPVRDSLGEWEAMGYVLAFGDRRFYHAGDTSPDAAVAAAVRELGPSIGFLPFNERNYYRERAGIIGNMSVREAFAFAEEIGLETVVPIHWDLFAPNTTLPEEIVLLYERLAPRFTLSFDAAALR